MNITKRKDEIVALYESDNCNSIRDIAKIIGCSPSGIKRILNKCGTKMRNKCESLNLCPDKFTSTEEEFLIGTMLGDGHLTKKKSEKSESCFYITHSEKQRDYIVWKYNLMKRFIGCEIYDSYPLVNGVKHHSLNFITRRSPLFSMYRKIFYGDKKLVPMHLIENLSDFSLAVWLMDDGHNYEGKGFDICTQSFSRQDNEQIVDILRERYGIDCAVQKSGWNTKIYIFRDSKPIIFNKIRPYVIPEMSYKLME